LFFLQADILLEIGNISQTVKEKLVNITLHISEAFGTLRSFRTNDGINILSALRRLLHYKDFFNMETLRVATKILKNVLSDVSAIESNENRSTYDEKLGTSFFV